MNEKRWSVSLLCLCLALTALGCDATGARTTDAREAPPRYAVEFRDRQIDLEPFLIGFPYSGHRADLKRGDMFYLERAQDGRWLRHLELGKSGKIDHAKGRKLNDIDWSERSLRIGRVHQPSGKLYVTSDEGNDERFNVYTIDLETGAVEKMTDNDYTYAWRISEDDRILAYLARKGLQEPFDTALMVRDLETGEEREIIRDGGGKDRFTWSYLRFSPDKRHLYLTIQHDGQRNTKSLAKIDLTAKQPKFDYIHEPRVLRYSVGQVDGWVSDTVFLYRSAEEGFTNVYRYDTATGRSKRITDFQDELRSTELLETEPPVLAAVLGRPHESELLLLDANTGKQLASETIGASVSLLDGHGSDLIVTENSLESPWRGRRLAVERKGDRASMQWSELAGVPADLAASISHYTVERVQYPTFDKDARGETRMLHGFLLEPKVPPKDPAQRLVRIKSFYGGRNGFDTQSQIMAAAGVATFSPAPRGSSGFGAEFAALNDGDLGGDEIVDVIYAAKWLEQERGYKPEQIGVYGGSHGGYATMRALTFPPETNGRNESYDFGFGWSHAGFSDIITFYDSCNIPDWVIKEAGHPVKEKAKLLDRSPISHVERLKAPLLLTHGSKDWRVPPDESRKFAARAEELGRPVTYVEFEGQGHGIRGFENLVRYYQTALSFMEEL